MHALDESTIVDCKIYDEDLNILEIEINDVKKNTAPALINIYDKINKLKVNLITGSVNATCQWSCGDECSESIDSINDTNEPACNALPIIIPIINLENKKVFIEIELCHTFKQICTLTKHSVLADKTDQTFIWNTISQCSKSILDSNLPQEILYAILSTFLDFEKFEQDESSIDKVKSIYAMLNNVENFTNQKIEIETRLISAKIETIDSTLKNYEINIKLKNSNAKVSLNLPKQEKFEKLTVSLKIIKSISNSNPMFELNVYSNSVEVTDKLKGLKIVYYLPFLKKLPKMRLFATINEKSTFYFNHDIRNYLLVEIEPFCLNTLYPKYRFNGHFSLSLGPKLEPFQITKFIIIDH
ncbi:hypothetical protein A3Q56_01362 [Intoshia linei]|uniref:Uncharacterized protein n=1 Tax=Intoshia linei TaxID=1819745 RepID=A0A177B9E5_9BILA|nr:hypothetical protein A3Q56_01362 [Intoshia linei]